MKFDVILAGLSGQGIHTMASIVSEAAKRCALFVSQPHLPRQSQRDGSVAHLRLSSVPMETDSILRRGEGDLLVSLEPLECLGYVDFLRHEGSVLTSTEPVRNIPNYPDIEVVLEMIRCLPHSTLIDAGWIAAEECMPEAANIVMLGAGARLLPLPEEELRIVLAEWFESRSGDTSDLVLRLFDAGQAAARNEHLVDEFATA